MKKKDIAAEDFLEILIITMPADVKSERAGEISGAA